MSPMNRHLGFNLLEWTWIVFVAYTAFLVGSFNVWGNASAGLGWLGQFVITPLLFTGLLGVGPALLLRGSARLIDRLNGRARRGRETIPPPASSEADRIRL